MKYESLLTNNEIKRYSRQIIVKEIGPEGQIKLRNARVLIVGLGGLGSPVAMYLAGSGVGTIGILDYDKVEIHNLQRQTLHREKSVGMKKTESATKFLKSFNSSINLNIHNDFLDENKIEKIMQNYDFILDCTDNIKTRYVLNDMAKLQQKVFIAASCLTWEGQLFIFTKNSSCFRCMFPEMKKETMNCDEAGVISPICGIIGSMQAVETIKCILELAKPELITFNSLTGEYSRFDIKKKNRCIVCTEKRVDSDNEIKSKPPPKMVMIEAKYKITWENYYLDPKKYTLIDIRSKMMFEICHIKDSINIPVEEIEANHEIIKNHKNPILLCKKGRTARKICNELITSGISCMVIEGGLEKFKSSVDDTFPLE